MAVRYLFQVLVLVYILATVTAARQLPISSKAGHLEENGGLAECWNALNELKSCTDEIILFFVNGQTDIGPECCGGIEVITRKCWPTMLTSLGFTSEEGNILRGYCDASSTPAAAPPLAASPLG